ncbi:MAG: ERF family protein [Eggerthellaceae bacterium]|nr:ERF family protein [Eggerthellaceae bacterium]
MSKFINFSKAKAAMPNPKKDTKAYNYKYATLAQVKEIVDPACQEFGIDYIQWQEGGILYTTVIDLESGEQIVADSRTLGGSTDQERGSSETYQRRYALLTVFGLAPEDDDGAAASKPRKDNLHAVKARLWDAIQKYAERHGIDPGNVLDGVKGRADYEETKDFFERAAYEFETAD